MRTDESFSIEVALYGGLRAFAGERARAGRLVIADVGLCGANLRARDVKRAVESRLAADGRERAAAEWMRVSVLATDDRVLAEDDVVPVGAALALLPPVNGG